MTIGVSGVNGAVPLTETCKKLQSEDRQVKANDLNYSMDDYLDCSEDVESVIDFSGFEDNITPEMARQNPEKLQDYGFDDSFLKAKAGIEQESVSDILNPESTNETENGTAKTANNPQLETTNNMLPSEPTNNDKNPEEDESGYKNEDGSYNIDAYDSKLREAQVSTNRIKEKYDNKVNDVLKLQAEAVKNQKTLEQKLSAESAKREIYEENVQDLNKKATQMNAENNLESQQKDKEVSFQNAGVVQQYGEKSEEEQAQEVRQETVDNTQILNNSFYNQNKSNISLLSESIDNSNNKKDESDLFVNTANDLLKTGIEVIDEAGNIRNSGLNCASSALKSLETSEEEDVQAQAANNFDRSMDLIDNTDDTYQSGGDILDTVTLLYNDVNKNFEKTNSEVGKIAQTTNDIETQNNAMSGTISETEKKMDELAGK